ncbi:MAG: hypothetical protein AB8U16_01170 [Rickettsiales endosymbiont of Dermacentor nuttalli]
MKIKNYILKIVDKGIIVAELSYGSIPCDHNVIELFQGCCIEL